MNVYQDIQGELGITRVWIEKPEPPRREFAWLDQKAICKKFGWSAEHFEAAQAFGFPKSEKSTTSGHVTVTRTAHWRETTVDTWAVKIQNLFPAAKRR